MTQIYPTVGTAVPADAATGPCMQSSAVAWPAILAGAAAATVVTLVMGVLGSSLGLALASPWGDEGATAKTIAIGAVVWMIVTQWVSAALGGYLSGRLRNRWNYLHNDEVFFRDTAHGFLTWSVATLVTACFLTSAASAVMGMGAKAVATVGAGAAAHHAMAAPRSGVDPMATDYFIDRLYRGTPSNPGVGDARDARMETMRIVLTGVKDGTFTAEDKAYLAELVQRRTGVDQTEANQRVDNLVSQIDAAKVKAKEIADKARKQAAMVAIFTVLSMMVGAFIASVAAALGGRERDIIS